MGLSSVTWGEEVQVEEKSYYSCDNDGHTFDEFFSLCWFYFI